MSDVDTTLMGALRDALQSAKALAAAVRVEQDPAEQAPEPASERAAPRPHAVREHTRTNTHGRTWTVHTYERGER